MTTNRVVQRLIANNNAAGGDWRIRAEWSNALDVYYAIEAGEVSRDITARGILGIIRDADRERYGEVGPFVHNCEDN